MFPDNDAWHAPVAQLPVHGKSAQYVASIGTGAAMHADFGSGLWDGGPIGIPYTVVGAGQPKVHVDFDFDDESDQVGYPIPVNAAIEGGPNADGDRHVLIVDSSTCTLYELYAAYPNGNGTWSAGSGAVWNLNSSALRPDGWTSADAAGLPILPGLVRYDEVASGRIDHAIRVTVPDSDASHLWPARHDAGDPNGSLPPMGLRLRLRASFDVSGFPRDDQVILQAMKTYGVIVADNGSPWYISGVPDERWNNDVLHRLGEVHGSDFEAVDASSLMADPNSGAVSPLAAGSSAGDGPAAVSSAAGTEDLFARGNDDALWSRHLGTAWGAWYPLGGLLRSAPSATSPGSGVIDVFARGADDALWSRRRSATGAWGAWYSLGGAITSAPAAVSPATGQLDVFARGLDSALWSRHFNGTSWSGWSPLSGIITSPPGAVAGSGVIDVFGRGQDGALWSRRSTSGAWGGWYTLGGAITSGPGAASASAGAVDVFARGIDNAVWSRRFASGTWGSWSPIGGIASSPPAATSPTAGNVDLFIRGQDGAVWTRRRTSTAWQAWSTLGGLIK
jgi:hypothetical protein